MTRIVLGVVLLFAHGVYLNELVSKVKSGDPAPIAEGWQGVAPNDPGPSLRNAKRAVVFDGLRVLCVVAALVVTSIRLRGAAVAGWALLAVVEAGFQEPALFTPTPWHFALLPLWAATWPPAWRAPRVGALVACALALGVSVCLVLFSHRGHDTLVPATLSWSEVVALCVGAPLLATLGLALGLRSVAALGAGALAVVSLNLGPFGIVPLAAAVLATCTPSAPRKGPSGAVAQVD